MRERASSLVAALAIGVTLGALPGLLHAADVRGNQKNQGKPGDQCSSSSDCQAGLRCMPMGKEKQCAMPPERIPPPT
jgi:hypothetical protein